MREGWKYKKLGEVCTNVENIRWNDIDIQANYYYVDLSAVDRETYKITNPQIITKETSPSRARQIIKKNDVLFATTRPSLKRVCLIPQDYDNSICSTGFCVLRPSNTLNSQWLFYCLIDKSFYNYIEPLQSGTSYPAVTDTIVKNYIIPIPPLLEQQAIVARLDKEFERIEKVKQNAQQTLNISQELFKSTLSEIVTPREGWEIKTLGEIADIIGGSTPRTNIDDNWKGHNLWITPAELNEEKYIYDSERKISDKAASKLKKLPVGTILFSSRAPIGKVAITKKEMYCNQGFKNLVCKKTIYNEYVYWYLLHAVPQLKALGTGATFKELSKKKMEGFSIAFPTYQKQIIISKYLDEFSGYIDNVKSRCQQIISLCDEYKQALLNDVFGDGE